MKSFLYLSDAKVEQHFAQIPQDFFSTAKADKLRINFGFADIEFSDTTQPPNRYSKLAAVIAKLAERESIGTLEQPKLYFKGSLKMQYGVYPDTAIVYFSGRIGETIVALIGSLKHVEGSQPPQTLTRSGWGSAAVGITTSLVRELNMQPIIDLYMSPTDTETGRVEEPDALSIIVGEAHRLIKGPTAEVEFVALRLNEGRFEDRKTLLGTPFYVAYAT